MTFLRCQAGLASPMLPPLSMHHQVRPPHSRQEDSPRGRSRGCALSPVSVGLAASPQVAMAMASPSPGGAGMSG